MARRTKASRRAAFRRANTVTLASAAGGDLALGGFITFDFSDWSRALNRVARTFARIIDDLLRRFARYARDTRSERAAFR